MARDTVIGKIDELDRLLIDELQKDSRQSARDIARKVDITPITAHRRINRLFEIKAVRPMVIINPGAVGFETRAFFGMTIQPGAIDSVVERLEPLWNIQSIVTTAGPFDLFILTVFRNQQELAGFICEELGKIPELVSAEDMPIMSVMKSFWKSESPMGKGGVTDEVVPRNLDDLEASLIRELEKSPRDTVANLGRKLNVSRKVVARKLAHLKRDHILDVVGMINPEVLGYGTQATILLKAPPTRINAIAEKLVGYERVQHMLVLSGQYRMLVSTLFHDIADLHDFVRTEIRSIPGIIGYEIIINLSFHKASSYLG